MNINYDYDDENEEYYKNQTCSISIKTPIIKNNTNSLFCQILTLSNSSSPSLSQQQSTYSKVIISISIPNVIHLYLIDNENTYKILKVIKTKYLIRDIIIFNEKSIHFLLILLSNNSIWKINISNIIDKLLKSNNSSNSNDNNSMILDENNLSDYLDTIDSIKYVFYIPSPSTTTTNTTNNKSTLVFLLNCDDDDQIKDFNSNLSVLFPTKNIICLNYKNINHPYNLKPMLIINNNNNNMIIDNPILKVFHIESLKLEHQQQQLKTSSNKKLKLDNNNSINNSINSNINYNLLYQKPSTILNSNNNSFSLFKFLNFKNVNYLISILNSTLSIVNLLNNNNNKFKLNDNHTNIKFMHLISNQSLVYLSNGSLYFISLNHLILKKKLKYKNYYSFPNNILYFNVNNDDSDDEISIMSIFSFDNTLNIYKFKNNSNNQEMEDDTSNVDEELEDVEEDEEDEDFIKSSQELLPKKRKIKQQQQIIDKKKSTSTSILFSNQLKEIQISHRLLDSKIKEIDSKIKDINKKINIFSKQGVGSSGIVGNSLFPCKIVSMISPLNNLIDGKSSLILRIGIINKSLMEINSNDGWSLLIRFTVPDYPFATINTISYPINKRLLPNESLNFDLPIDYKSLIKFKLVLILSYQVSTIAKTTSTTSGNSSSNNNKSKSKTGGINLLIEEKTIHLFDLLNTTTSNFSTNYQMVNFLNYGSLFKILNLLNKFNNNNSISDNNSNNNVESIVIQSLEQHSYPLLSYSLLTHSNSNSSNNVTSTTVSAPVTTIANNINQFLNQLFKKQNIIMKSLNSGSGGNNEYSFEFQTPNKDLIYFKINQTIERDGKSVFIIGFSSNNQLMKSLILQSLFIQFKELKFQIAEENINKNLITYKEKFKNWFNLNKPQQQQQQQFSNNIINNNNNNPFNLTQSLIDKMKINNNNTNNNNNNNNSNQFFDDILKITQQFDSFYIF